MFDVVDTIDQWLTQGRRVALATVVQTWGSSPRQPGALMGVTDETAMIGSVSGGCVETAVVAEATDSLADGRPRLLNFGVSDDAAWDVGLACGGKIAVYVEPLDTGWWQIVARLSRANRAGVSMTVLDGPLAGEKIVATMSAETYASTRLSAEQRSALIDAGFKALLDGSKTNRAEICGLDVLVHVLRPMPHLIIVGGAHVAMALQRFAEQLGFRVSLVDPRSAFATPERFPTVHVISHEYPDKALPELGLDKDTYVAVLTHDPKIDDPALRATLPADVAYVGVLSSKRAHQLRVERMTASGFDPALLERVHTPIGLEIEAKTPEEIALSIMAEIVAVRNGARP
jgi:xanthine dehydrogenase accessory factor